jgi:ABC-2 type transport system ATP-binding protein
LFGELAASGLSLLVSSHVMDEASRCDELMLMRDGRLLAHDTVASILEATGTADIESAFLMLVEGQS